MSSNFYSDNDDLRYYVEGGGLDWSALVSVIEQGFTLPDGFRSVDEAVSSYKEILELVGGFVAEQIAPHHLEIDRQGLIFKDGEVTFPKRLANIFDQINEMGLYGMSVPRELGGMNVPLLVQFLASELIGRGDVSVLTHFSFHGAIATAMLAYAAHEGSVTYDRDKRIITDIRFKEEIGEIIRGEAWGSMDITEPDAGSDMAALRARAVQDENGQWRITGQKIFITSGHGKYHFVVARTESDPNAGLSGLSLFLVPAYETAADGTRKRLATVERIEDKLGHHASPTCVVNFENTPGYLVGKRGEGFKLMLLLMNGARIAVGFEGLGQCEAAYRMAKAYAAERPSMGKTIDRHELIADMLDEMRTDIQGLRALTMHGGFYEELSQRVETQLKYFVDPGSFEAKRLERDLKRYRYEARRVTPLIKFLAGEKAVEMARRAMQIHGGVGYTKEYGAEKLLRDSLAMPIYEGTTQIQALMAMKDTLSGVMKNPQEFVKRVAQTRWRALSARDPLERRVAKLQGLALSAQQHLLSKTATDKLKAMPITSWPQALTRTWDPKRDFAYAMLHAERLTKMLCDVTIAELLFEQSRQAPHRREVLERHLERAEPRVRFLLDEMETTGDRLIAQLADEPKQGSAAEWA